ncbi:AraC family transcriptional regulator [Cohnella sp. JJ-181]|uniref:AraC family transcriptional regulator n=1 Tax=Cohnella rhizoplanae TaxID=2974897 RepID=UPI0022FF906A|nr:AraC family transcriptional regulator [Cohnella sp. JJ-181]CAI6080832.1 HTH-type transcriptional activator RhaR [Cohnella sp. JJ-181]
MKGIRLREPDRLTNREYMHRALPFRLYVHELTGDVDVHWHEFFELGFVVSGEGEHVLNGRSSPLRRGTLFLLTPADFHALRVPADAVCVHYNLIFSDEALREELRALLFVPRRESLVVQCADEEIARIEAEFARIAAELRQGQRPGASLIVQGTIERILIELIRRVPAAPADRPPQDPGSDQAVRQAIAYMQIHFREPLTLEATAAQAHLSPNYFSRRFRELTGMTYQRFLQQLRLQFASALLKVSRLPVTEICFASGFNTLPHFERAFKAAFGQSPRSHRSEA